MPLIPDGTYKIRSVAYKDYVVDLVCSCADDRPIQGIEDHSDNKDDKWKIVNTGNTGYQITIESVSTPGYFVDVSGADLVGDTNKTVWNVIKVDHGYALESLDNYHVWRLVAGADNAPIELVAPTAQDDTKWYFDLVSSGLVKQKKRAY